MTKQAAPTPKNPEPESKKWIKNAAYAVLVLLLLALAAGGVYARYVYHNADTDTVLAREFYFTSDQLSTENPTYTLSAGTESVSINLKNYVDALRITASGIDYTVTVDNGATVSSATGSIAGGGMNSATVTVGNLEDGKTYVVTATGTAGYVEELKATFTVLTANKVYAHLDTANPAYVLLTVWTENVIGDASISFPAGLIPDATDPVLDDIANYSGGTYGAGSFVDEQSKADEGSFSSPYSSHSYRFFKEKTTDSYTLAQFTTISVNGISATEAIP